MNTHPHVLNPISTVQYIKSMCICAHTFWAAFTRKAKRESSAYVNPAQVTP